MKIENNDKLLKIFSILILGLIPLFMMLSFYLKKYGLLYNSTSINLSIILYIALPILIYIYITNIIVKKIKLDKFDYIALVLIVTSIITTIFSIDPLLSIFGSPSRREGMISIVTYYMIFLNWKNSEENGILRIIYILGIINIIYSLLQIYTDIPIILRYTLDKRMATGILGNPNFLGSFIVTILCMLSTNFLIKKDISKSEVLVLVGLFITLFLSQSTGPFIAYILTIIFIIIKLLYNKKTKFKKFFILFSIGIITYTIFYFANLTNFKIIKIEGNGPSITQKCELCNMSNTINTGFNGRFTIWRNTLEYNVKNYWLTGTGFENFKNVYPNKRGFYSIGTNEDETVIKTLYTTVIYDKAHNVYLNILADAGVINLIPYLLLCLLVFIIGLKLKSELGIILLSGFIAYSIQAFGNISVIQVAPIYYIIMGLIVSEYKKQVNP